MLPKGFFLSVKDVSEKPSGDPCGHRQSGVSAMQTTQLWAVAFCLGLGACGSDSFQQSFTPRPVSQEDDSLGPRSPIVPNTRLWYSVTAAFRRTSANNSSGMTIGEAQSGGVMCVNITDVKDTATKSYVNAAQTMVSATIKITDTTGDSPVMHVSDQNNANASPADVDNLLQNLWLKRLTFPSSGHGYSVATTHDFFTQNAPLLNADFSSLLFFETRSLAAKAWSGWQYSEDLADAHNYLDNLLGYFLQPPYGQAFFVDRQKFDRRIVTPPAQCDSFADARSCAANNCTWALPPGGNSSQCLSIYSVHLGWRESINAPTELAGPVFHLLEYSYNNAGILMSASEIILPDIGGELPLQNPGCGDKCLSATLINNGTWESGAGAPCAF